ncbi:hypothetical protein MFE_00130 [Mycoplasmopsis fermentans JER]|nr:hypothetical protein MFE_00130 [Mycoplasmopsis fermentans JER]
MIFVSEFCYSSCCICFWISMINGFYKHRNKFTHIDKNIIVNILSNAIDIIPRTKTVFEL